MESITRNVAEMGNGDRQTLERLLGQPLHESQQVVIQVVNQSAEEVDLHVASMTDRLPTWRHVYEGLSDDQVADLEKIVLARVDLSRFDE